ncbi:MAG: hypothetical protein AB9903_01515 [Vulcanimicrobiota bacterium]
MIKKTVAKKKLLEISVQQDTEYWLSRSAEERLEAVELLRRQYHGNSARLQRIARVIKRP